MYAHEVLQDLEKFEKQLGDNNVGDLRLSLQMAKKLIPAIHKFHVDEPDDTLALFKQLDKTPLFTEMAEYIKLPYPIVYFDWKVPQYYDVAMEKRNIAGAAICMQPEKYKLHITLFTKMLLPNCWYLEPLFYSVDIGAKDSVEGNIGYKLLYPTAHAKIMAEEDIKDLSIVNVAILLLNCRNIITSVIKPSEALNKSRLRKGKLPHYTYKVLSLGNPSRSEQKPPQGGHNRVHFRRGHFKVRRTGIFWWQPHLCGRNKEGFVDKDYVLKP